MALFDKLKGVADKAKEAATKAVTAAADYAEQAIEKEEQRRLAAHQAAQQAEEARKAEEEARRLAAENERKQLLEEYKERIVDAFMRSNMQEYKETKDKFLEIASEEEGEELELLLGTKEYEKCDILISEIAKRTDCDQGAGDCGWLGCHFYCTCGKDVDCPRKKYITAGEQGVLISPDHLPYIKFLSSFKPDGDFKYYDEETGIHFTRAFSHFFNTFLPEHVFSTIDDNSPAFNAFVIAWGMGAENVVMDILFSIHQQTDGKIIPPVDFLMQKCKEETTDLTKPFFKNPSLYDRTREEMEYTVSVLYILSDRSLWPLADITSEDASYEKLFNEDGSIKAAGIGGPRKGYYGDVIYNLVGSWMAKDE